MIRVITPSFETAERMALLGRVAWQGRERPWTAAKFLRFATTGDVLFLGDAGLTDCLIVLRIALDEAEILNLGVVPTARRRGLATRMMEAAETEAALLGVRTLFLEVAFDNEAALALYRKTGFEQVGRRKGYYLRPDGSRADALVMRKEMSGDAVTPLAGLGQRAGQ
ncbi:GNAT family N-acetyltransferase [Rhodobacteraceae bacterium NNCM2]|nr:GNAT family N-acetyltransferase [Coraliihabitans acroporae]